MNIYVANLNFKTTEEQLKNMFAQFGTVSSVKIIVDRETNRSRGFAFVEMPSDTEANNAIQALNNKTFAGRNLSVSVAKDRQKRM
jgi:RNA recognition motif-containing protein